MVVAVQSKLSGESGSQTLAGINHVITMTFAEIHTTWKWFDFWFSIVIAYHDAPEGDSPTL